MTTTIQSLQLFHQGKVRDTYVVDDEHFLMVTSDRISAFDVIMNEAVESKGKILSRVSNFWFHKTESIIKNHLTDIAPESVVKDHEIPLIKDRSVVVKRLQPLPVESIVRGYLIGSGWKDYQSSGSVSGITLPKNLQQAEKLAEPIFTPSTKAAVGDHDENISFDQMSNVIGEDRAKNIKDKSIEIYNFARDYALHRGIIIADTKFEFGLDDQGDLILMDEILTPDSSRFWDADLYKIGTSPQSFDKQFLRDWLESIDWNKQPPPPSLPSDVIEMTKQKYQHVQHLLLNQ
ncbi:phosphoribosylaminoimidazole-succinocarboxamide synthase [Methylophilales bacterium MBRSG12]|uniref:Phosphoribosylaminoimidazole-succinocarboxamide synthase n=1 Tax=Methylophilales bacterium MBRS-H7 TaxID=1623450 RepID=A0A0H4IZV0_9PROT|nr:phosphoribosylaminoimidazole-succinocarboxamide synthase [Methylophilales bacterium MBRSF5]AKO66039.1 phosphoribosylaminoimidazole-succinocarboxamide synthase [Methylophilales bacterium MBRS-H7]AKO67803.1 phosphoribosylaminoimidazole-succinocarboxamide synthase [Methylophilales bacterium MBRSG12]